MDRREFSKSGLLFGAGLLAGSQETGAQERVTQKDGHYLKPPKNLPIRNIDVVVVGAGASKGG